MSSATLGPETRPSALHAEHITKSFNGNVVLRDFGIDVAAGSVHALLGHNGSGKSTFIKILSGFHEPDDRAGVVEVAGKSIRFGDSTSSNRVGLSFVHQTLGLVPSLSVLENLHLGKPYETDRLGRISWRQEHRRARAALAEFGLQIDPGLAVADLSTVEKTEVAIVRSLSDGDSIRILVLDEPTAALTEHEVQKLFHTIDAVKARGVGVLYVSHRLEEIAALADEVTVLRDGEIVGRDSAASLTSDRLRALISGASGADRSTDSLEAAESSGPESEPLLELTLTGAGAILEAALTGYAGEILGVVGLLGSGVDDLARVVTGGVGAEFSDIRLLNQGVHAGDVARMTRVGLAMVVGAQDERAVLSLSVADNLTLPVVRSFFEHGLLNLQKMRRAAEAAVRKFGIRPQRTDILAQSLSGGNVQKMAIGRAMASSPRVVLLEEPFRGVDAGGRTEIAAMMRDAADGGCLVLVVDSDLDQIAEVCNRVLVFREGLIQAEYRHPNLTKSVLLEACYGE